ncbi:MAG: hypothetical protein ABIO57_00850 [Candidatus Paceibacterota bacterium]
MDEDTINDIEGYVQDIPEEVKEFIFGDEFEAVKNELSMLVASEAEKIDLPNEVLLFLFGTRTKDELISYISTLITPEVNKQKIKEVIDKKVIAEILLLIDVYKDLDHNLSQKTEDVPIPKTLSTSLASSSSLTSLAERLKQSSMSSPTTRNYTLQKGTVPDNLPITEPGVTAPADTAQVPVSMQKPVEATAPTHTIDPYHESIDNI